MNPARVLPMKHQFIPREYRVSLMPGDVESIKIEMAGMKSEVLTKLDFLAHDIKNIVAAQSALVTRREIDDMLARRDDARKALADRVVDLEHNQTWAVRAIIGAWIAGTGVLVGSAFAFARLFASH